MSSTLPSRAKGASADSSARSTKKSAKSISAQSDSQVVPARFTPIPFPAHTGLTIDQASTGDHMVIHQLLLGVNGRPSQPEFQAQVDYPLYEPTDRLVARRGKQVVGHILVAKSTANCLAEILPIATFHDLCVLPEFKGKGIEAALMNAAEIHARQDGAIFALMRTGNPAPLMRAGWAAYGRYSYARARARDVLSHLAMLRDNREETVLPVVNAQASKCTGTTVRLWRHIEEEALIRLYDHLHCHLGLSIRNDAHWRWLISTAGHDRIYIAINGTDKPDLDGQLDAIVGYAVVKDDRIIEIVSAPNQEEEVISALVGRACSDAIERGSDNLQVEAPIGSHV
ncbi:MAG: GNAT superfamily N-acetyltransferase, partial [Pirellulaceae bacterium]